MFQQSGQTKDPGQSGYIEVGEDYAHWVTEQTSTTLLKYRFTVWGKIEPGAR